MALPIIKVNAWGWRLIIFAAIFTTIFYIRLWQPARQIELHQKNFLLALEDRNWRHVRGELADNYSDRFGHNRETAVKDLTDVLRQFFALSLRAQGTQTEITAEAATVSMNITMIGTGPGLTDFITNEVNKLPSPWVFSWKKASFLPWDWKLEKVDNATFQTRNRGAY